MAERIYYQGWHVGWRLEGYDNVPSSVQEDFINLINGDKGDKVAELEEKISELYDNVEDAESEITALHISMIEDDKEEVMIKGEVLR